MHFLDPAEPLPAGTLLLENTADVLSEADRVATHTQVALAFPKWTDGRAYSQAVLLRSRLRFEGGLIATGEVLVDMLPLLRRCGFDAVQLGADQSRDAARRALGFFDGHYQTVPPERAEVSSTRPLASTSGPSA